jgi:hypothetical protein
MEFVFVVFTCFFTLFFCFTAFSCCFSLCFGNVQVSGVCVYKRYEYEWGMEYRGWIVLVVALIDCRLFLKQGAGEGRKISFFTLYNIFVLWRI